MTLFLSEKNPWKKITFDDCNIHFIGCFNDWAEICNFAKAKDFKSIKSLLNDENGCYAFIIESKDLIFATVDHICSTPIYYSKGAISNCARSLQKNLAVFDVDKIAVNEFCMTGYSTGSQTLYKGLYMLQAGESVFLNHDNKLENIRHFSYLPHIDKTLNIQNAKEKLGNVLDDIFKCLVKDLNGRTVLLPLSGGLDSRLVIAKLLEHGHDNIISFSYGVKGNGEALIAKEIASKLNVKWLDLPSENPKELYNSQLRKDFDYFVDGLSVVPSYLDFEALYMLSNRDDIPSDAVIINGQTGDFIAGAHIPDNLIDKSATIDMAINAIAEKHYRQRPDLEIDKDIILNNLKSNIKDFDKQTACALYEFWEWQERQAKAVMVGQRSYDFFGYDWRLPLWDKRLVDFFAGASPEMKCGRKLMVEYLNDYDPKGIFMANYPEITSWSKKRGWIKWVARACGIVAGKGAKESCYARFYYFSNYHNQFALFGYKNYLKHLKKTQRFVGQAAIHWLKNQGIDPP